MRRHRLTEAEEATRNGRKHVDHELSCKVVSHGGQGTRDIIRIAGLRSKGTIRRDGRKRVVRRCQQTLRVSWQFIRRQFDQVLEIVGSAFEDYTLSRQGAELFQTGSVTDLGEFVLVGAAAIQQPKAPRPLWRWNRRAGRHHIGIPDLTPRAPDQARIGGIRANALRVVLANRRNHKSDRSAIKRAREEWSEQFVIAADRPRHGCSPDRDLRNAFCVPLGKVSSR